MGFDCFYAFFGLVAFYFLAVIGVVVGIVSCVKDVVFNGMQVLG